MSYVTTALAYVLLVPLMIVVHVWLMIPFFLVACLEKITSGSNCYFWALHEWIFKGGKLVLCRSKYGWWLHTLHIDQKGAMSPNRWRTPPNPSRAFPRRCAAIWAGD